MTRPVALAPPPRRRPTVTGGKFTVTVPGSGPPPDPGRAKCGLVTQTASGSLSLSPTVTVAARRVTVTQAGTVQPLTLS